MAKNTARLIQAGRFLFDFNGRREESVHPSAWEQ